MRKLLSLFAAIFMAVSMWGTQVNASSFSAVSGTLDEVISYESFQGGANNAPAISSSAIRLYQRKSPTTDNTIGGYITITAASGYKINEIVWTNGIATTYTYSTDVVLENGTTTFPNADYNGTNNNTSTISSLNCSSITLYARGTSSSDRIYLKNLTVFYSEEGAPAVNVTGVTLNQTSVSVDAGEKLTLTATVAPADAANKNVNWTSSNESVATVANGVVSALAPGTTTITATTEDGGFTATCEVMVTPTPYALAYTFDFTVNNFSLPTSALKGSEGTYTYDGKTIKLYGDASNGFKFSSSYLIMGKSGAYLTLPAFDFPVGKIVVEGNSGASASTIQNIYVGETAVSTPTTGSVATNEYVIADAYRAAGNVYTLKITSSHNAQITAVKIYRALSANINVSAAGYATYFNADQAVELPTGVEGYVWDNGLVKVYDAATSDNVVPAGEPVVLKAAAGNYTLTYTTTTTPTYKSIDSNALEGAATAMTAAEMETANPSAAKFYALTLNAASELSSVGFYWVEEEGAAFDIPAGKAYLALPAAGAAPRYVFNATDEVTAVENVEAAETVKFMQNGQLFIKKNGVIYNAMGQAVK